MLGKRKLVVDTFSEISDLITPYIDAEFWNFAEHVDSTDFVPGAIYVIGREQLKLNQQRIRQLVEQDVIKVIFSNPNEGSDTLKEHCAVYKIRDLVLDKKIFLISGGDMELGYPYMLYDSFLPKILDYEENVQAITQAEAIFSQLDKPYKFLFLNGRIRAHRKYLLEKFKLDQLLDQSLYTCLDYNDVTINYLNLMHKGQDLILTPNTIKTLPAEYEVDRYSANVDKTIESNQNFMTIKFGLFNNEWGEIYLNAKPYIDTYFSLVTETVFISEHSFRTEKLWKPVAMGHPFIVASGPGYYRDLHNLGFRTFGHVIDESFDRIDNHQERIERIATVVKDLCQQDLASFLKECYTVCKYNQQHLAEMRLKVRQDFPDRFSQFIEHYGLNE